MSAPTRISCWTLALLTLFATSCGGGRVDPEFTEPIEAQPMTRARPHDVGARGIDSSPPSAFAKPKLVVIRADWCGYCRTAQPGIDAAYDAYRTKVDLVVLDVTDESSTAEAARIAAHEGVRRFFSSYQGRTPTVGVFVGPEDGRLVHGTLEDPELLSRELSFALEQFRTVR